MLTCALLRDHQFIATLHDFCEERVALFDLLQRLAPSEERCAATDAVAEHLAMQAYPARPDQRQCPCCERSGHIQGYCLAKKDDQQARHVAAMGNVVLKKKRHWPGK